MELSQVFGFIRLTQKFRSIVRDVSVDGGARFENDMEHSYQLAMFLWYFVSSFSLNYDINKLIRYALIHDLVETYAGDTPALTSSQQTIESKSVREEHAFKQIISEVSEFAELAHLWEEYMSKSDKESRLVYVIDKVMPILNEIQQDSQFYKNNKISLDKWNDWLQSKLDTVSYGELEDAGFIKELLLYLDSEQSRLFYSPL